MGKRFNLLSVLAWLWLSYASVCGIFGLIVLAGVVIRWFA